MPYATGAFVTAIFAGVETACIAAGVFSPGWWGLVVYTALTSVRFAILEGRR